MMRDSEVEGISALIDMPLLPALLLTGLIHAEVCPKSYHMEIAWIDYPTLIFEEVFIPYGSTGTYLFIRETVVNPSKYPVKVLPSVRFPHRGWGILPVDALIFKTISLVASGVVIGIGNMDLF